MKLLIQKPYLVFWSLIPFILLIGIILGDDTFDINIHDTYFVFTQLHFSFVISFLVFIIGLIYFFINQLNRSAIKFITFFHFTLTFISLGLMYASLFKSNSYIDSENPLFDDLSYQNVRITLSFLAFLFGLLIILPINLLVSIFRRKN